MPFLDPHADATLAVESVPIAVLAVLGTPQVV